MSYMYKFCTIFKEKICKDFEVNNRISTLLGKSLKIKLPFMKLTEQFYFKCTILVEKICCQHQPPLSNHDNNTIKNQKSHFHAVIHVFDKEHEEIIIKIGVKVQIQYTKGENTFCTLVHLF